MPITPDRLTRSHLLRRLLRRFAPRSQVALHLLYAGELRRWVSAQRPAARLPSRLALYDHLRVTALADGPMDFLELGVWNGESILHWSRLDRDPSSRFFGFDTFTGLPEDWHGLLSTKPRGSFTAAEKVPATSDSRVTFVRGSFQDTLRPFLDDFAPRGRIVVHVDCDLYSSTLYLLCELDRVLAPGSILLFDEFCSAAHEFRALMDYAAAYRREHELLAFAGEYEHVALRVVR